MTQSKTYKIPVFSKDIHGVRVTNRIFSARYKDIEIENIIMVEIIRWPLWIACMIATALFLVCAAFDTWLEPTEQMSILAIAALIVGLGYSIAGLSVQTQFNQIQVFWNLIWIVKPTRLAIRDAKETNYLEEKEKYQAAIALATHNGRGE